MARPLTLLLGLVPMLGLAELLLHQYFAGRAPGFGAYAALAPELKKLKQPGMPVVVAPPWAEPLLRQAAPEAFPMAELTRPDASGFSSFLEVSALGQSSPELSSFKVRSARQFGPFTLTIRDNPRPDPVRFDFVTAADTGELEVYNVWGQQRSACQRVQHPRPTTGGLHGPVTRPRTRYECTGGRVVGVTLIEDQEYRPHRCILVEPVESGDVVLRFTSVPPSERLVGFVGFSYFLARDSGGISVDLSVTDAERELGKHHVVADGKWSRFELKRAAPFGAVEVVVERLASEPGDFCFRLGGAMTKVREFAAKNADALIATALFAGYLSALLATAGSLGFMRDEGFYFAAARAYGAWFELLWRSPGEALSAAVVDRYWTVNHEHPSLIKSLFWFSSRFLSGLFAETSTSFRFPGMVLSSLAVAVTFSWGRSVLGRAGGVVAALSFALMPRVFFHAHLACFDLPVCSLWLVTGYIYTRSLRSSRRAWVVAAGVAYGLLLDTKHNSWIFPFALGAHFALVHARAIWRGVREKRLFWPRLPRAWLSMLVLGPLVFFALWPWIWHDTLPRLKQYADFHLGHEYYNMEFMGRTYWQPPMPRGYAWLMTAATVPLVTLVLFAIGALHAVSGAVHQRDQPSAARSDYAFWGVSLLVSYAPWLSTNTPIFGGTKHWMTAYPFLCLFAGLGFVQVRRALATFAPKLSHAAFVGVCVLVGPLVMTAHSHPFGLSAYTALVGGAPGAANLGLNRTFWGYTTQSLAPFVNQSAPKRGAVYVHDTALSSFAMFQEDGRLRRDLRGTLNIAVSDVALYHHEPHMSRVEQQIWATYGSNSPDAVAAFDGVPIAWAYVRMKSKP